MVHHRGRSMPDIKGDESFGILTRKLASYLVNQIERPESFDDLRHSRSQVLKPLAKYLVTQVHHPAVVAALMALRGHFDTIEKDDQQGINAGRSAACEVLALSYVVHLSERDAIDILLYELPTQINQPTEADSDNQPEHGSGERSPLLGDGSWRSVLRPSSTFGLDGSVTPIRTSPAASMNLAEQLGGLNALEIAAVSGAKKFLSQQPIQRIVTAIWDGDIIFWSSLRSDSSKYAQTYKQHSADPYCRLRVPKYLKAFEVLFFLAFLVFYYIVLVQRSFHHVTAAEILLYVWLASFAHNELGEFWDAGVAFYLSDFWTLWDLGIIAIGAAFFCCRMVGLSKGDNVIIDTSFDILAMEALVLVPRIFSLLSLHPYFGTLLPCLKEMTKDFMKFLSLVVILYLGFLTTFSLLARGHFSFRQMSWILIKVFFGSSYLGFDVAEEISPILGPPLMFIFICLTNILLITSLISILSNTFAKVIEHARDEYLFVYSVFVLEASTSNKLTYFIPPLNLIPLLLRPLRLFYSAESLRTVRISLLKASHFPHVCAISLYEMVRKRLAGRQLAESGTVQHTRGRKRYSTPQLLVANNLKPTALLDQDSASASPAEVAFTDLNPEDLQATLAHLSAQMEAISRTLEDFQRRSATL